MKQEIDRSKIEFEKKKCVYETKMDELQDSIECIEKQLAELNTSYDFKVLSYQLSDVF